MNSHRLPPLSGPAADAMTDAEFVEVVRRHVARGSWRAFVPAAITCVLLIALWIIVQNTAFMGSSAGSPMWVTNLGVFHLALFGPTAYAMLMVVGGLLWLRAGLKLWSGKAKRPWELLLCYRQELEDRGLLPAVPPAPRFGSRNWWRYRRDQGDNHLVHRARKMVRGTQRKVATVYFLDAAMWMIAAMLWGTVPLLLFRSLGIGFPWEYVSGMIVGALLWAWPMHCFYHAVWSLQLHLLPGRLGKRLVEYHDRIAELNDDEQPANDGDNHGDT